MTTSGPADSGGSPRGAVRPEPVRGDEPFDLLVVGGGVSGACIALESAWAGLRTALVEREDYGAGTSANSLKILHGGLRDLRRFAPLAVRSGAREQAAWSRLAPHLIDPLPFLLPTYRTPFQSRLAMRAALTVAGLLSPVPARARLAGWSLLEREEALALVPDLPGPVTGAAVWHEGRMYSAERLVLAVVARAVAAGASAANHTAVTGLLRSGDGSVVGVRARDTIGGTEDDLRARRTVLATGAACGHLARALLGGGRDAGAPNAGGGHSLAVNVVLGDLGYRTAFAIRSRQRGGGDRQLVFVPWRGRTLLGTGHYEYAGDPAGFDPARVDPAPLLEEANAAWDGPRVREEDVALVHAGLLPLDPSGARAPDRLLREPEVRDHGADGAPGLLSVTSVRFSYARVLARRTVAAVASSLARPATTGAPADAAAWPRGTGPGRSGSRHTERAPAARPGDALDAARADALRAAPDLPEDVREHLVRCYGADAAGTIRGMRAVPGWDRRVLPDEPVIFGQFVHGVRAEMARTTADLVWRRTEIGPRGLSCDAAEAQAREALAIGPGRRGEVGDGGDGRADGRG